MSRHYSKVALNTYAGTPYFQAHVPPGYPLQLVLQAARRFLGLPTNLRRLSTLSRRWARRHRPDLVAASRDWYDDAGYELDPDTGRRLTDAEVDAEWDALNLNVDPALRLADVPEPDGGFPDPRSWEPPADAAPMTDPSLERLQADIATHGRRATSAAWGIPLRELPGWSPDTREEREGEDWGKATARFKRRAARVLSSPAMTPEYRAILDPALRQADMYWDLSGDAKEVFDRVEDHT